ncbi:MAG: FecR domain-containing protein [Filimonas sp.]|nr:FecR domain-containing protein [Filimonas sp.]
MSIHMNFDSDHIEQLIYRRLAGDILPEENAELESIIQKRDDVKQMWSEMSAAHRLYNAGQLADKIDTEKAWENIKAQVQPEQKARVFFFNRWVMAASVILLAGIGILSYKLWFGAGNSHKPEYIELSLANGKVIRLQSSKHDLTVQKGHSAVQLSNGAVLADAQKEQIDVNAFNTLAIPHGKDYHLQLADGTEVWLNAATELQFPLAFSGNTRRVKIKGEAYFKVAHDAAHPFIVETLQGDVQVLGTEFNVKNYPGEAMATSLVNGSIHLHPQVGEDILLQPGQAFVTDKSNKSYVEPFNEIVTLGWMRGLYYFNNCPLEDIRGVVERWYNVQVTFKEGHGNKRFTGVLEKNKPLTLFLNNISISSGIPFNYSGSNVLF